MPQAPSSHSPLSTFQTQRAQHWTWAPPNLLCPPLLHLSGWQLYLSRHSGPRPTGLSQTRHALDQISPAMWAKPSASSLTSTVSQSPYGSPSPRPAPTAAPETLGVICHVHSLARGANPRDFPCPWGTRQGPHHSLSGATLSSGLGRAVLPPAPDTLPAPAPPAPWSRLTASSDELFAALLPASPVFLRTSRRPNQAKHRRPLGSTRGKSEQAEGAGRCPPFPGLKAEAPGTVSARWGRRDDQRDPPHSPGGGAPARPSRVPGGSARRPRLGFLGFFRLRLGLGIKARGQELIHRQLRQAPAGPDTGVTPARQPGACPPPGHVGRRGEASSVPRLPTHRLLPRAPAMPAGCNVSPASGPRMPRASRTSSAGPTPCPAPRAGSAVLRRRFRRPAGGRACARLCAAGAELQAGAGEAAPAQARFGRGSRAPPLRTGWDLRLISVSFSVRGGGDTADLARSQPPQGSVNMCL